MLPLTLDNICIIYSTLYRGLYKLFRLKEMCMRHIKVELFAHVSFDAIDACIGLNLCWLQQFFMNSNGCLCVNQDIWLRGMCFVLAKKINIVNLIQLSTFVMEQRVLFLIGWLTNIFKLCWSKYALETKSISIFATIVCIRIILHLYLHSLYMLHESFYKRYTCIKQIFC